MAEPVTGLLDVEGLNVDFEGPRGMTRVVKDVSFRLNPGETLALLGESGSGKSMTASAVMGLIPSPPGKVSARWISYRGSDLLRMSDEARRDISGKRIAMIFQDTLAALNPVYSVGWQVAETLRVHGHSAADSRRAARDLLERVGVSAARHRDYPHQFSGGQRQRVMIAMALALRPDILIADEPTTALDVTIQAQILRLLVELQAETGMGILLITHDLGVVAETADRVAVMYRGSIVETGEVRQVLKSPQHDYTKSLLAAVPGSAHASFSPPAVAGKALFRVRDLRKDYTLSRPFLSLGRSEPLRALDGVSFDIRPGEIIGVVGESGSGKSTLGRALLGIAPPTSGTVEFRGQGVFGLNARDERLYRRGVQAVLQDPTASLNPRMSIADIIAEPWTIHPDVVAPSQRHARIAELLERVELKPEHMLRYPHQFSGGQRQRIAIARALTLNPEILICDEAVSALDVSVQAQVMTLLKQLHRDLALSYVFITHDLLLLKGFATRILVMNKGRIVEDGPASQVLDNPTDPYTRQLVAASPDIDPDKRTIRSHRVDEPETDPTSQVFKASSGRNQ